MIDYDEETDDFARDAFWRGFRRAVLCAWPLLFIAAVYAVWQGTHP